MVTKALGLSQGKPHQARSFVKKVTYIQPQRETDLVEVTLKNVTEIATVAPSGLPHCVPASIVQSLPIEAADHPAVSTSGSLQQQYCPPSLLSSIAAVLYSFCPL